MNQLVTVEKQSVLTDTQIIARSLGIKHAYVMDVINKFLDDYPDLRVGQTDPKIPEYIRLEQRNYRGRDFTAAVMNKECFTLLFMRFETPKARELQRKFNTAFYEMEKALLREKSNSDDPMWLATRRQSKAIRLGETDVIKQFVEYATLKVASQHSSITSMSRWRPTSVFSWLRRRNRKFVTRLIVWNLHTSWQQKVWLNAQF